MVNVKLLREPVPTLKEISKPGQAGISLDEPPLTEDERKALGDFYREDLDFVEVSKIDVVRHFMALSHRNWGVDVGFYPLGSCTMKYNPKFNERAANMDNFLWLHPLQPVDSVGGLLQLLFDFQEKLAYLTGMDYISLQPAAGAHGEYTALLIAKAYFEDKKERRDIVLVPDSAHGTNPASASMAGFKVITVKSDERGNIDLEDLKEKVRENKGRIAVLMLTNPNTLGLFEEHIEEVVKVVKEDGGLLYYDGANFNAIIGLFRPGDMGFDMLHLNLHKTFSTPHGAGGPGSGPIGVKAFLRDYLPVPILAMDGVNVYLEWNLPKTIGKVKDFYGNIGVILRAYAYLIVLGEELKKVAYYSVLNSNYLKEKLKDLFENPFDRLAKHEFVLSARNWKKEYGVRALDIAKRLLDYGFHAPTIYFPLIVEESLMIEPTETETKETIDRFAETLRKIKQEAESNPELLKEAPHNLPVRRIDEATASRKPKVKW